MWYLGSSFLTLLSLLLRGMTHSGKLLCQNSHKYQLSALPSPIRASPLLYSGDPQWKAEWAQLTLPTGYLIGWGTHFLQINGKKNSPNEVIKYSSDIGILNWSQESIDLETTWEKSCFCSPISSVDVLQCLFKGLPWECQEACYKRIWGLQHQIAFPMQYLAQFSAI